MQGMVMAPDWIISFHLASKTLFHWINSFKKICCFTLFVVFLTVILDFCWSHLSLFAISFRILKKIRRRYFLCRGHYFSLSCCAKLIITYNNILSGIGTWLFWKVTNKRILYANVYQKQINAFVWNACHYASMLTKLECELVYSSFEPLLIFACRSP